MDEVTFAAFEVKILEIPTVYLVQYTTSYSYFMEHFKSQRTLRHRPEYKHLVKQYNDTGVMLMKFELNVQENWKNLKIQEIESMISKPVFSSDISGDLRCNFDPIFFTFLKVRMYTINLIKHANVVNNYF